MFATEVLVTAKCTVTANKSEFVIHDWSKILSKNLAKGCTWSGCAEMMDGASCVALVYLTQDSSCHLTRGNFPPMFVSVKLLESFAYLTVVRL